MNQDIVRTDNVLEAGHHFLAGREQHDFYLCRLFGVGKQECIFEAFGCFLGFIGGQPLLKQRRKGSLVDTLSGGEISDELSQLPSWAGREHHLSELPLEGNGQIIVRDLATRNVLF